MAEDEQVRAGLRIGEILEEKDAFRVIIRGQAAIEDVLDEAIDAAFTGGTPGELKRLRLPSRLALAAALELLTTEVAAAIALLAKIRHQFAHGAADELTDDHVKLLRDFTAGFYPPEEVNADDFSPDDLLRIVVGTVWHLTQDTVKDALDKRATAEAVLAEAALAESRRRRALSASKIAELLASAEGEDDSHPVAAES